MITRVGGGMVKVTGTAAMFCGLWTKGKARKMQVCTLTRKIIPAGHEQYRPLTNGIARTQRVKAAEMERFLDR